VFVLVDEAPDEVRAVAQQHAPRHCVITRYGIYSATSAACALLLIVGWGGPR
jgi:hypothetical protein